MRAPASRPPARSSSSCRKYGAAPTRWRPCRATPRTSTAEGRRLSRCCLRRFQLHLFGIDILGVITLRESDTFTAGQGPTVADTVVLWRLAHLHGTPTRTRNT